MRLPWANTQLIVERSAVNTTTHVRGGGDQRDFHVGGPCVPSALL
jgi:hypothetical protein